MDFFEFLAKLNHLWKSWNLKTFIVISFALQCILIFASSWRKQMRGNIVYGSIWLTYLLADWVAYYAIGLIPFSSAQAGGDYGYEIRAFWAPFLLLHIGGPNTIAGFALEDSRLWKRSILHIISQSGATLIVIFRSLPRNRLLKSTSFMFVAAFTRYLGRILAMHTASPGAFLSSLQVRTGSSRDLATTRSKTDDKPYETDSTSQTDHINMVVQSHARFLKHMGVFIGLSIRSLDDVSETRQYFKNHGAIRAFTEMEIELTFAYDLFYTKIWSIIEGKAGKVFHFVSLVTELIALVLWILADKRGYEKIDIQITNTLVFGGIALDAISVFKLMFTDLMIPHLIKWCGNLRPLSCILEVVLAARNHKWGRWLFRRWSSEISLFDLMSYSQRQRRQDGRIKKWAKKFWHWITGIDRDVSTAEIADEMKDRIFKKMIQSFPGSEQVTQPAKMVTVEIAKSVSEEYKWKQLSEIFKSSGFADGLLLWYIVTSLLNGSDKSKYVDDVSKSLSKYLMYLLFRQPQMILEGVGTDMTLEDMREDLKDFKTLIAEVEEEISYVLCETWQEDPEFIGDSLQYGDDLDIKSSVLQELYRFRENGELTTMNLLIVLAGVIKGKLTGSIKNEEKIQQIVSDVWVDLLLHAAINCKARTQVDQLSRGAELLTVVWLMMTRLGFKS